MRPSQQRSGFTLIELLAVMAIMGAMLALSIAAFSKMGSGSSIRASSMMFKSSVSMARQNAITKRTKTTITFGNVGNPSRGYYAITFENKDTGLDQMIGVTNWLSDGIAFYESGAALPVYGDVKNAYQAPLVFKVDGGTDNGATARWIGMRESRPGTNVLHTVLRLQPLTGRITEYER